MQRSVQHLNIPLSRHTKTTRSLGRVVWLLVGFSVVGGFLAYRIGAVWFSHGGILSLAPTDTVIAVELHVNKRTAPFLLDWLAGVPLLSDRSLELRDLVGYTYGDLAIFVTKSGQRSVAIRSDGSDLPKDLLDNLSIIVQEQGSFILLSSTIVPISGIEPVNGPLFSSIGKAWFGRVVLPEDRLVGNLFVSKTSLTLEIETPKQVLIENQPLLDGAVVLGGLSWWNNGSILPGLERLLAVNSFVLRHSGAMDVAIVPTEFGPDVLLRIQSSDMTSEDLIGELEQIGAFARPTIVSQTLPDGSKFNEILVQPELISVEEISTNLGTSYRVPIGGGSYTIATLENGSVLFSNSQTLLESYEGQNAVDQSMNCSKSFYRVDPSFLVGEVALNYLQPKLGLINGILDDFSGVFFEFKKYSTTVRFCRF